MNMSISLFSLFFFLFGGVFILFSIVNRWVLMNWYLGMSESSWFFWGRSIPYIRSRDGRREFVKCQSKISFVLGLIHLPVGGVLIPFSYNTGLLIFVIWLVLLLVAAMSLRFYFIDLALEINRRKP
jgi:hypothetical protein